MNKGDLWELAAAIVWAVHVLLVDHYSPGHSVGALTFTQVAVSAVLTAIFLPVVWAVGWETPRVAWTANLITAVLITALGATAVAFSIQVWAQRFTTPTHVAILFSLEPVFAALTSFVVYGKWLSGRAIVGAALLLAGILAAELKEPPATPEGATAEFKASR